VWNRFSLKNTIDSKVNEGQADLLKEGEEGTAISALRPMGKADFEGKQYEVSSLGPFIESGTKIKIIKIASHHIIVEPLS
jgi:membrane-bound ClpP family serine protease